MWISSGVLILVLAAGGLLVLACYQARDLFRMDREWASELKRYRRSVLTRLPRCEQLPLSARLWDAMARMNRERAQWHDAVEDLTDQREAYELRVRYEIDRLVGKEVYHGHKEQL